MSMERRREQERPCPCSNMYWVSGEKEERRDDLADPEFGGGGGSECKETSSGKRILSLSKFPVFSPGKEKEKGGRVVGNDGFSISFRQRVWGGSKGSGTGGRE
jgi:hypothetical protein